MKKVLIAIGNEKIYNEIKDKNIFNIISDDIQYKEGIIELLEKNNDIDFIILNNLLPGSIETTELINKINLISNKIKIIIYLEKSYEELEKYLYSKKIYRILYDTKIEINTLIDIINNNELNKNKLNNEDLKEEIEKLKDIVYNKGLFNKNNKKNSINNLLSDFRNKCKKNGKKYNWILNKIKKFRNKQIKNNYIKNVQNNNIKKDTKIISIIGTSSVGKSIFSINLSKINSYLKNRVLIIDFDYLNNSINTILGLRGFFKNASIYINKTELTNNLDIKLNKIKINSRIDLISIKSFLLENNKNINSKNSDNKYDFNSDYFNKIIKYILNKELNNNYNLIIVDTNSFINLELNKEIINLSNLTIFISDTNLLEINKTIKLLDHYINRLKINKNNFNIIFNKYNSESININLLKNIFSEFNILGYLSYNKKYNKLINKNTKYNFYDKKIRKEYLLINNLILTKLR